jgi:Flp pilus assembly protein TadD
VYRPQVAAQHANDTPPITIVRMAPAAVANEDEQNRRAETRRRAARERAESWAEAGRRALAQGRLLDAVSYLHSAITADPDSGSSALLLGETYVRVHRCLEAIPRLQRALELGAEPRRVAPLLAFALRESGDRRAADAVLLAQGLTPKDEARIVSPMARNDVVIP